MIKRDEQEKEPNHERWLVSYGDLLTLLFAVFVVLYAMSETNRKKVEEVSESMKGAFSMPRGGGASKKPAVIDAGRPGVIPELAHRAVAGAPGGAGTGRPVAAEAEFRAIKGAIEAYLQRTGSSEKVQVELTRRGLVISLKEAGFFDSGSAVMKNDASEVVGAIADALKGYSNRCRVEGHTDNVPIRTGRYDSNWDLSTARATYLVKKLVDSYGVDAGGISAAGYAEFRPVAENNSAGGRARNRRVDIVLLSSAGDADEPLHLSAR